MLLGESEPITTAGIVGGFVTVAGILGGAIVWMLNWRKAGRKDSLTEWQDIATKLQVRVDAQDKKINEQGQEILQSRVAEARCNERVAQLEANHKEYEGELRLANVNIRRLQEALHDTVPGVTRPVVVVASTDGIIRDVSPEVASMFHWLPKDLIGKSVKLLMAKDAAPIHSRGMDLMLKEGRKADPSRPVPSYGQTKEGRRFPVWINLSGPFEVGPGVSCLTAEISRRGDSDAIYPPLPADGGIEDTKKAPE